MHDMQQIDRQFVRENRSLPYRIADVMINPTRSIVDKRTLSNADHIIFNSKLTRSMWENYYEITADSDVIYNGVDNSIFYPRCDYNNDYVLFVGNTERKGISNVISFARDTHFEVKVVGDPTISEENIDAIGRVGQDVLASYFSKATATIHPARFEAFGNVILESLSCGTPVVVSNRCGAAEILDDDCGVVTDNIHEGIQQVQHIPPSSCVNIAEKYSWKEVATRTEDVIKKVTDEDS